MRVLTVAPGPEFSVYDVWAGTTKGLGQCGADVRAFNLHDRIQYYCEAEVESDGFRGVMSYPEAQEVALEGLRGQIYDFWPHVIVFTSGFLIPNDMLDLLRNRGHKVVMIHTESPYEDDRQIEVAKHCDVNFLNDPINLAAFQEVCEGRAYYLPHAYDPDVHHNRDRVSEYDFAFVGTAYGSRVAFLEAVDFGDARVALAGNWGMGLDSPLQQYVVHDIDGCLDNADTQNLYRSSDLSLNLYRIEANQPELSDGWAMGPREVELAATGTCYARQSRPEGDELFPMLPIVEDPDQMSRVLRWSMDNPDERREIAEAARLAVADRTFKNNADRMLQLVSGE